MPEVNEGVVATYRAGGNTRRIRGALQRLGEDRHRAQPEHVSGGMITAVWKATTRDAVRSGRGHLTMTRAAGHDRPQVQKRGQR